MKRSNLILLFLLICFTYFESTCQEIIFVSQGLKGKINIIMKDSVLVLKQQYWNTSNSDIYYYPAYVVLNNNIISENELIIYAGTDPNPSLPFIEHRDVTLLRLHKNSDQEFEFSYPIMEHMENFQNKEILYFGFDYLISKNIFRDTFSIKEDYFDSVNAVQYYTMRAKKYYKSCIWTEIRVPFVLNN